MEFWMFMYVVFLIISGVATFAYWFVNRPKVYPTSVVAITNMLFEDSCHTYMDPNSGVVFIDPKCSCCVHHRVIK